MKKIIAAALLVICPLYGSDNQQSPTGSGKQTLRRSDCENARLKTLAPDLPECLKTPLAPGQKPTDEQMQAVSQAFNSLLQVHNGLPERFSQVAHEVSKLNANLERQKQAQDEIRKIKRNMCLYTVGIASAVFYVYWQSK